MAAEGILAQILAQGFGGLLTNLATAYTKRSIRKISNDSEVIKRDLRDHLEITFNKCMNVKTILKTEIAAKTLEIYVDQVFKFEGKEIDQYSMVDLIREGRSCIIIGEGGGGKSMFMRYLWLSYFEKSDGKIPFFLELRNLNSLTHSDISDFIFHSIVKGGFKHQVQRLI
jgi:ABC-type glutathione transport system ATPase component